MRDFFFFNNPGHKLLEQSKTQVCAAPCARGGGRLTTGMWPGGRIEEGEGGAGAMAGAGEGVVARAGEGAVSGARLARITQ